jgi:hypothetical protein
MSCHACASHLQAWRTLCRHTSGHTGLGFKLGGEGWGRNKVKGGMGGRDEGEGGGGGGGLRGASELLRQQ